VLSGGDDVDVVDVVVFQIGDDEAQQQDPLLQLVFRGQI